MTVIAVLEEMLKEAVVACCELLFRHLRRDWRKS
jgi:hypothetical protein